MGREGTRVTYGEGGGEGDIAWVGRGAAAAGVTSGTGIPIWRLASARRPSSAVADLSWASAVRSCALTILPIFFLIFLASLARSSVALTFKI